MVYSASLVASIALSLSSLAQGYVIQIRSHEGKLQNFEVPSTNLTAEEFLESPRPVNFRRELEDRESPCASNTRTDYWYKLIGDGNPHQNYKIAQVADTLISCPGSITKTESHTFGWSIGGGINPGVDEWDFASLGFEVDVSETSETSDQFTCAGAMTEICVMHYTAVTAVSVELWNTVTSCDIATDNDLGAGTVYLPNANSIGSTMSMGTNFGDQNIIQCRGQSEREVDFLCGPAGGPEWFDTNEYGPWSAAYQAALDPAGCPVPIEALKFTG